MKKMITRKVFRMTILLTNMVAEYNENCTLYGDKFKKTFKGEIDRLNIEIQELKIKLLNSIFGILK